MNCDFLQVCYLLLYGELPTQAEKDKFVWTVTRHTMVHEQLVRLYSGFRRDSHPMAVMVGVVGALSAFYHDSLDINNPDLERRHRLPIRIRHRSIPADRQKPALRSAP